jgi:hypothetical protein
MPVIKAFKSPSTRAEAIQVIALALQDALDDIALVVRAGEQIEIQWDGDSTDPFSLFALDGEAVRAHGLTRGVIVPPAEAADPPTDLEQDDDEQDDDDQAGDEPEDDDQHRDGRAED